MVLINQVVLITKDSQLTFRIATYALICLNLLCPGPILAASQTFSSVSDGELKEVKALVDQGAYSKARPLMHKLLMANPTNPTFHLVAARLYKKMGLWSRAIIEYEWVRARQPDLSEPYIALSEMYMENLSSQLALSMAEEATYLSPDSQEALSQLIKALIANQEFSRAERALETLINRFPEDPNCMHLAFSLRKDTGDYKEAKKYLEKAIRLKPSKISWLLDLYSINMNLHDTRAANQAIDLYLAKSPRSIDALLKKARLAEVHLYDLKEAEDSYKKVIELDPESFVAEAGLERIKRKQIDAAEAIKRSIRRFFSQLFNWIGSIFAPTKGST